MKALVTYFSAEFGAPRKVAEDLAAAIGVPAANLDLFFTPEETLRRLSARIGLRLRQRAGEHMAAEAILFSRETGLLCRTDGAEALLREIMEG